MIVNNLETYLKEVKERCEAATEGPWIDNNGEQATHYVYVGDNKFAPFDKRVCEFPYPYNQDVDPRPGNRSFIAHSRTDIPRLLEIIESMKTSLEYITDEANGKIECHNLAKYGLQKLENLVSGDKYDLNKIAGGE